MKSDKLEVSIKPEKDWCRLKVGPDVAAPIKRFMFSTMPSKLWYATFHQGNYKTIHYMRKYDGWMVIMYKDRAGDMRYQTMGSYMHTFLDKLIGEFIEDMGKVMEIDHALKLEITCRDKNTNQERLHDLGCLSPDQVNYVAVVTDYFQGYSKDMDHELSEMIGKTNPKNRVNRYQEVETSQWRCLWKKHSGGDIKKRLDDFISKFPESQNRTIAYPSIKLEVAEAFLFTSTDNIVHFLAQKLKEEAIEGYVLHCISDAHYDIRKLKIELLGGLGHYYSYPDFRSQLPDPGIVDNQKHAGRQMVARCLTVECLPQSFIPFQLGIGYWSPKDEKYVVANVVKLKDVLPRQLKSSKAHRTECMQFLHTPLHEKHNEITSSNIGIANLIAYILSGENLDTLLDTKNLSLTRHFTGSSSGSFLNVSKIGILVGVCANMLYLSQSQLVHIQAPVAKCIGISENGQVKELKPQDHYNSAMEKTKWRWCMNIEKEWTMEQWKENTDLGKFNKCDSLSKASIFELQTLLAKRPNVYQQPSTGTVERPVSLIGISVWCYNCKIVGKALTDCQNKGMVFLNYKPGVFTFEAEIPPEGTNIDMLVVDRGEKGTWYNQALSQHGGNETLLFQHVTRYLTMRCIVVNVKFLEDKETREGRYKYPSASRYADSRLDSEGKPWHMGSTQEVESFLVERQKSKGVSDTRDSKGVVDVSDIRENEGTENQMEDDESYETSENDNDDQGPQTKKSRHELILIGCTAKAKDLLEDMNVTEGVIIGKYIDAEVVNYDEFVHIMYFSVLHNHLNGICDKPNKTDYTFTRIGENEYNNGEFSIDSQDSFMDFTNAMKERATTGQPATAQAEPEPEAAEPEPEAAESTPLPKPISAIKGKKFQIAANRNKNYYIDANGLKTEIEAKIYSHGGMMGFYPPCYVVALQFDKELFEASLKAFKRLLHYMFFFAPDGSRMEDYEIKKVDEKFRIKDYEIRDEHTMHSYAYHGQPQKITPVNPNIDFIRGKDIQCLEDVSAHTKEIIRKNHGNVKTPLDVSFSFKVFTFSNTGIYSKHDTAEFIHSDFFENLENGDRSLYTFKWSTEYEWYNRTGRLVSKTCLPFLRNEYNKNRAFKTDAEVRSFFNCKPHHTKENQETRHNIKG